MDKQHQELGTNPSESSLTLMRERISSATKFQSVDEELNKVLVVTDLDTIRTDDERNIDNSRVKIAHVDEEDLERHHKEPVKTRHMAVCSRPSNKVSHTESPTKQVRSQSFADTDDNRKKSDSTLSEILTTKSELNYARSFSDKAGFATGSVGANLMDITGYYDKGVKKEGISSKSASNISKMEEKHKDPAKIVDESAKKEVKTQMAEKICVIDIDSNTQEDRITSDKSNKEKGTTAIGSDSNNKEDKKIIQKETKNGDNARVLQDSDHKPVQVIKLEKASKIAKDSKVGEFGQVKKRVEKKKSDDSDSKGSEENYRPPTIRSLSSNSKSDEENQQPKQEKTKRSTDEMVKVHHPKQERTKSKGSTGEIEKDHHHHHHHHHHHRHHHHHKRHGEKDAAKTTYVRSGAETKINSDVPILPTELDEAISLPEKDLEDMTVHRLEDAPAVHRHPIKGRKKAPNKFTQVNSDGHLTKKDKPTYDHTPHEVFVELEELKGAKWRETARWIKFEENLEEHANRWGKPHVATLSFHSLLELRRCFEYGTVLLDLDVVNFAGVLNAVIDDFIATNQLSPNHRSTLSQVLGLKHSHHHGHHGTSFLKYVGSVTHLANEEEHSSDEEGLQSNKKKDFKKTKSQPFPFHWLHSDNHDVEAGHAKKKNHSDVPLVSFSPVGNDDVIDAEDGITISVPQLEDDSNGKVLSSAHTIHEVHSNTPALTKRHDDALFKKIPVDSEGMTVLVGSLDMLDHAVVAFVRLSSGRRFHNMMQVSIPVRFFFILIGPSDAYVDYREVGRAVSTLMSYKDFKNTAYKASCRMDLLHGINYYLDDSVVLPPGEWDKELLEPVLRSRQKKIEDSQADGQKDETEEEEDDPLLYTKRPCGGFIRDIRRRYVHYWSDITDALNLHCLTVFFFIFFACMAPAITFGAVLGDYTHGVIGISEMLAGTSLCGIVFAVFAGQPLLIMGATGPVLVFEETLYDFCGTYNVDFLTMRLWVGLWIMLIMTVMVICEASFLIRYLTRFTEEIFACLISMIYIYEAFKNLNKIFKTDPILPSYCFVNKSYDSPYNVSYLDYDPMASNNTIFDFNSTNSGTKKYLNAHPNTALLSTIYLLSTFSLIYVWKVFRRSRFLGSWARHMVCDFSIMITFVIMVLINQFAIDKAIYIKTLDVRPGFLTLSPMRKHWAINPFTISIGWIIAAFVPAVLVSMLLFMEIEVTQLLMSKKALKMKKGSGFHLDLLLNGLCIGVFSIFGLPWMCAATVRSISHLKSLTVYSKIYAPGDKPKILSVREQRMTALFIHIFVGISLYFTSIIKVIPYAVILGVLLYMGVASINGIQYFKRLKLLFMPLKHHTEVYVRNVRRNRIISFTFIQTFFVTILWILKLTPGAIVFPILVAFLVPFRMFILSRLYSAQELEALDDEGEDPSEEKEEDEYHHGVMPD